jgi:hypothetical protein
MSELSGFWTTNGTATGDQQTSYTQAHWSSALKIISACNGFEGVSANYLSELACTATGANTIAVNTGGAMVDGKWYYNDSSKTLTIPSASGAGNTRIDRIVLRADWANFNVSLFRIAGTDAATPSAPVVAQTSGTTYDIMLYQALVDTDGAVILTDERVYGQISTNDIADDAVTGTKMAAESIDSDQYVDGSIDTEHIANAQITLAKMAAESIDSDQYVDGSIDTEHIDNAQITLAKMAAESIDSDQYVDGSIDTEHIANDAVDDTKAGNRIAQFYRRQGGDETDWSISGTTTYTPSAVRLQGGVIVTSSTPTLVTFPTAFSQKPIVLVSLRGNSFSNYTPVIVAVTATTFQVAVTNSAGDGYVNNETVNWLAIGPE